MTLVIITNKIIYIEQKEDVNEFVKSLRIILYRKKLNEVKH